MATEPRSRRRRLKKILRSSDGSLYDVAERRRIPGTGVPSVNAGSFPALGMLGALPGGPGGPGIGTR